MRAAIVTMLCALLCACHAVKPTAPAAVVIEKPVKVYVPIPADLRARCPWPKSGKPSQAIEIARKRRECLERYELQFDGIGKVQGQPAP